MCEECTQKLTQEFKDIRDNLKRATEKFENALKKLNFGAKMSKLWEFNVECPECGKKTNHQIKACETGLSYCSEECMKIHVNKNAPEGGY